MLRAVRPTVLFGAQLWSQASDWPRFRDAAVEAEAAGWDSTVEKAKEGRA